MSGKKALPKVRGPRGAVHAVWATGSVESGSLYGFYTLCGLEIDARRNEWPELDAETPATCAGCLRRLAGGAEQYR